MVVGNFAGDNTAVAVFQRGLTYQKMGETEKSYTNFDEAIRLFNEVEKAKIVNY